MLIDARTIPSETTVETDVCIAGAGVAGLTLAREFIGANFRCCLLESGGLGPDKDTQSLYWGESIGHPYFPLDMARACGLGGSSHRWSVPIGNNQIGVRLRPMDDIDFEEREWVPYSGWPFKKSHLIPFYKRAQSICKINPFTDDIIDLKKNYGIPLPFKSNRLKTVIFQFCPRNIFTDEYPNEIIKAENITILTFANVVEIETNNTAQTVTRLRMACLNNKKFWLKAKLFILALGAIETPRILLLSNRIQKTGLGNHNDLVGRFFMEHPHIWSGTYIPSDPDILNTTLYRIHKTNNVPVMGKIALSEEVLRKERLLNYCVSIHPQLLHVKADISPSWHVVSWPILSSEDPRLMITPRVYQENDSKGAKYFVLEKSVNGIKHIIKKTYRISQRGYKKVLHTFKRSNGRMVFQLNHMTEQSPNPDSKIGLSDECDIFGRKRVRLDWRLNALDMHTIIRAQQIIDEELRMSNLGRLQIDLKNYSPPSNLTGGWHHMGTTRMHNDPKKGVVDMNCRVHGISNLFIAGPSVFPTCGYANPVLTVVALAVRLADHIKKLA